MIKRTRAELRRLARWSRQLRLPTFQSPVVKGRPSVSRRAMIFSLGAVIVTSGLPVAPKAQAKAWLRAKLAVTQVLTPGSGYTADHYASMPAKGATLLSTDTTATPVRRYGRPEYTSYGQIDKVGGANYAAAIAAPTGHFLVPSVTGQFYSTDFDMLIAAFCANLDGIRDGVGKVRTWANGAWVETFTQTANEIQLDAYRGGVRKVPSYKVRLSASVPNGTLVEIWHEIHPTDAMKAQGMKPRLIGPMFMTKKAGYDVVAIIDHNAASPSATLNPTGSVYKTEGAFAAACASDMAANGGAHSGWHYYASYKDTTPANTTVDVLGFGANSLTNSLGKKGRIMIDGGGAVTIANTVPANQGAYQTLRPRCFGLDLKGFKIDCGAGLVGGLFPNDGEDKFNRLIGCEIFGEGIQGVDRITGAAHGGIFGSGGSSPTAMSYVGNPVALEQCFIHDIAMGDDECTVKIGCKFLRCGTDCNSASTALPYIVAATDFERQDTQLLTDPKPIVTLAYAGSGTPTYGVSGTHNTATRTLTLYVDGTAVSGGTFTATTTGSLSTNTGPAADNSSIYTLDQLVAAINAVPGGLWSASLVANVASLPKLRFASLAYPYTAIGVVADIAGTGSNIPAGVGVAVGAPAHVDYQQFVGTTNSDNVLFLSSYSFGGLTELIHPNCAVGYTMANMAFVNIFLSNSNDAPLVSTLVGAIGSTQVHLLAQNITQSNGRLSLLFTNPSGNPLSTDQFTRIGNIYALEFNFGSDAATRHLGKVARVVMSRNSTNGGNNPTGLPGFDYPSIINLNQPGSSTSKPGSPPVLPTFDVADFPNLVDGSQVSGQTGVPAHTNYDDAVPALAGPLRLYPMKSQTCCDIRGKPFNDNDLVGAVSMAA